MQSVDVRIFQVTINKFVSESELPTEVKKLVLADVLRQVADLSDQECSAQLNEMQLNESEDK